MRSAKLALLLIILAAHSPEARAGLLGPSDFCECVLADLPGIKNDVAAWAEWQNCSAKFKGKCSSKASSWFAMTFSECVRKYAGDAQGEAAPGMIAQVCATLYSTR